jgi:ABC-2 type transport system permease protein
VFEAGRYPVDIYRPTIRWGLTYIVPLAFLTTYPAGALIGRVEPGNVGAAFLLAGLALTGATLFWRYGIRHYSGASA